MIIQLRLDVAPFAIFPKLEFVLIYTKILRNSILLSEQRDQLVVLESVEHSLPCSSLLYRKLFSDDRMYTRFTTFRLRRSLHAI